MLGVSTNIPVGLILTKFSFRKPSLRNSIKKLCLTCHDKLVSFFSKTASTIQCVNA